MGVHKNAIWTDWSNADVSTGNGSGPHSDCKDCVDNYVDDFIIFSDDVESHISDLRHVLSRLKGTIHPPRVQMFFLAKTQPPT